MEPLYQNRAGAGRALALRLGAYVGQEDILVLALPRGGVPVACEVAKSLNAELDVYLVRKLGVPGHEELAMGAIAEGGVRVLNDQVVDYLHISSSVIEGVAKAEQQELERRAHLYRRDRPAAVIEGRTVILIDDGLATGSTMRAAAALRRQRPARVIVAVPVAAADTCEEFRELVDETICAATPEPFYAVGAWYEDFSQTSDEEVQEILERAQATDRALEAGCGPTD